MSLGWAFLLGYGAARTKKYNVLIAVGNSGQYGEEENYQSILQIILFAVTKSLNI